MSQATTMSHGHSSQVKRSFGIQLVAAAVVASLLTATVWSPSQPTVEGPAAATAPAMQAAAAATPGTSVPDASTVFDGKDRLAEETAPTF